MISCIAATSNNVLRSHMKLKYLARITSGNYIINTNRYASQSKNQNYQPTTLISPNGMNEVRQKILDISISSSNFKCSTDEFKQLRTELIEKYRHINDVNVDAIILGLCNSADYLNYAKDYINFMKSEGIERNNASWGRLLKLYYYAYKAKTLTNNDINDILEIYQIITTKNTMLDPTTCEHLILGLIITDQWLKSLDLLEMIKITCVPNVNSYSAIIAKSFQTQEYHQIGWNLLKEMIENQKQPRCEVFIEYFDNIGAMNSVNFIKNLEFMLNFISTNEIILSRLCIEKLQEILNNHKIQNTVVSLTKLGKCLNCQTFMERISITNSEFISLRSSFLDSVLVRNDTFLKSTPEEVDEFVKFVDRNSPFHCIIDGLNVAYSCGTKHNNSTYANLVVSVVRYFVDKKMKILILGRKHMKNWPSQQMNYIKKNAKIYLTNNLSQDDPFLLYAALKSGPTTDFFSRDLMRSHVFLLDNKLKQIFKKWQQEHQFSLITTKENGQIIIKEPVKHNIYAHKVNRNWHVPFKEQYLVNPSNNFEISKSWLCFSY